MSDFWHEDVPLAMLDEALDVIDRTPSLVYQILSKRPGNAQRRLDALKRRLPSNVWVGATIGHERSLPLLKPLRRLEATLRFLSCEPLLTALPGLTLGGIGWVIAGGQSGRDATPMHPNWVRDLRDECAAAAIPFHFKQWGEWIPGQQLGIDGCSSPTVGGRGIMLKGESALFEGREFDVCALDAGARNLTFRVGKHRSGALLDGREWREFPMTPSDSAGA